MDETKYKVGDKVRIVKLVSGAAYFKEYIGTTHTVSGVKPGGVMLNSVKGGTYWKHDEIELASKTVLNRTPRFILQLGASNDFEVFSTDKELRACIAKKAKDVELDHETIKVFDIKRVRSVKLGVKITIQ